MEIREGENVHLLVLYYSEEDEVLADFGEVDELLVFVGNYFVLDGVGDPLLGDWRVEHISSFFGYLHAL